MRCKTDGGGAYPGMESRRGNFSGGKGREGGRGSLSLPLPLWLFFCLLVHSILARGEEGGGKEREREHRFFGSS